MRLKAARGRSVDASARRGRCRKMGVRYVGRWSEFSGDVRCDIRWYGLGGAQLVLQVPYIAVS